MTTETETIETDSARNAARALSAQFERTTRTGGAPFVRLKEHAPTWCTDVVRQAHGMDMSPDDYRYDAIAHLAQELADRPSEEWEDDVYDIVGSYVDVYTHELTGWLHSHLYRVGYVNDTIGELGQFSDIESLLRCAQEAELLEIAHRLIAALQEAGE